MSEGEDMKELFLAWGLKPSNEYSNKILQEFGKLFINQFESHIFFIQHDSDTAKSVYGAFGKFLIDKLLTGETELSEDAIRVLDITSERSLLKSVRCGSGGFWKNDRKNKLKRKRNQINNEEELIQLYRAKINNYFDYSKRSFLLKLSFIFKTVADTFTYTAEIIQITLGNFSDILRNSIHRFNDLNSRDQLIIQIDAINPTSVEKLRGLQLIKYLLVLKRIAINEASFLVQKFTGLAATETINNLTLEIIDLYYRNPLKEQTIFYQENSRQLHLLCNEPIKKCFNQCIIDVRDRITKENINERISFYTDAQKNIETFLIEANKYKTNIEDLMAQIEHHSRKFSGCDSISKKLIFIKKYARRQFNRWHKNTALLSSCKRDLENVINFYKIVNEQPFPEKTFEGFIQIGQDFIKIDTTVSKLEKEYNNLHSAIETEEEIPGEFVNALIKVAKSMQNDVCKQREILEDITNNLNLTEYFPALSLLKEMFASKIAHCELLENDIEGIIALLTEDFEEEMEASSDNDNAPTEDYDDPMEEDAVLEKEESVSESLRYY